MIMAKNTYNKLFESVDLLNKIRMEHNPKFTWAITRSSTRLQKVINKYQEKVFDINLEYCEVYPDGDKKGTIMKDSKGQFSFTKEGEKAKSKAIRELGEEEFEFEPYFAKLDLETATQLGVGILEAFSNIFLDPTEVEKAVAELEEVNNKEIVAYEKDLVQAKTDNISDIKG